MSKSGKGKNPNPKKGKTLIKLLNKSDSDTDESEHELSHYLDDRVKLMREVMKIIKPKKIKSMAPKWMRNMDIKEINSMLFEELLGISNKRLKGIFNGQTKEEDSSSTDPELEDEKHIDIISLDDVTDDEFIINLDSDDDSKGKQKKNTKVKVKEESKKKKVKKEKRDKSPKKPKDSDKEKSEEQNLMSVLELLELQARARAIKSQLALENQKKAEAAGTSKAAVEESDHEDAVIIESPKNIEIVITSSESENEESKTDNKKTGSRTHDENTEKSTIINKPEPENTSLHTTEENKEKTDIVENQTLNKSAEVTENDKNSNLNEKEIDTQESPSDTADMNNLCNEISEENSKIINIADSKDTEPQTCKPHNKIQIHNISILTVLCNSESTNVQNSASNEENVQETIHESPKDLESDNNDSNSKKDPLIKEGTNTNQIDVIEEESKDDKTQITRRSKKNKSYRRRSSNDSESENSPMVSVEQVKEVPEHQAGTMESVISTEEVEGIVINVDQSEIECISD